MPLLAVGTFNTNELFTVLFDPEKETLELLEISQAKGNHSWLSTATIPKSSSISTSPTHLYATCWTQPPSVAAYRIQRDGPNKARFELLNSAETAARSGYVYVGFPAKAAHPVLYSCGGPTGEVFGIDSDTGAFDITGTIHEATIPSGASTEGVTGVGSAARIQEIDFVTGECSVPGKTLAQTRELKRREAQKSAGDDSSTDSATTKLDASGGKNAMGFGGLRHGSHGIDLSPDGSVCYIPDIGRNCVWTMNVDPTSGALSVGEQSIAPRKNDGPRHTVSHPGGRYIYSLQEHSSMVDVFELIKDAKGTRLEWKQGVKIIPQSEDEGLYWADEVRRLARLVSLKASIRCICLPRPVVLRRVPRGGLLSSSWTKTAWWCLKVELKRTSSVMRCVCGKHPHRVGGPMRSSQHPHFCKGLVAVPNTPCSQIAR